MVLFALDCEPEALALLVSFLVELEAFFVDLAGVISIEPLYLSLLTDSLLAFFFDEPLLPDFCLGSSSEFSESVFSFAWESST